MKMRERSPARVLPSHHGGLILTCLTLVSLFVTNTSGSYQLQGSISTQPSPVLPESMMSSQFSGSSQPANPPVNATLVMECRLPFGSAFEHCWMDNDTLIFTRYGNLLKATINRQAKTCTYTEYDSITGSGLACSPERGEIYLANYGEGSVWIYDKNGLKAVWKPEGLLRDKPDSVAVNQERIVIATRYPRPLYVYDINRVYVGRISVLQDKFTYGYIHLTEEGLFVATTGINGHRLIIHDIVNDSTVIVGEEGSGNGQFDWPRGVTSVGDYVVVCDSNNQRLPVFDKNGRFHTNLHFNDTDGNPWTIDYRAETKLLAVNTRLPDKIKILSLS